LYKGFQPWAFFLKQEFISALHEEEIALNNLKTITKQWEDAKKKLEEFRKGHDAAIKLNNEIAFILCKP
jgi:hypothetical protein